MCNILRKRRRIGKYCTLTTIDLGKPDFCADGEGPPAPDLIDVRQIGD